MTDGVTAEAFAPGAVRLAGWAGAVLGWSADAFWRATPAELEAVVRVLDGSGGGEGEGGVAPPDAGAIARMREAFPDG